MKNLYTIIYATCLNLTPKESVAIITDTAHKTIAHSFWREGSEITNKITLLELSTMTENGQEPPEHIGQAMNEADIALLLTTYSLSHTKARMDASARGTRIISMPGITEEILERSVDVDYEDQKARTQTLTNTLSYGTSAAITAKGGTNIRFSIDARTAEADTGFCTNRGDFINLPAGEAFVAPIETSAEGVIVFDGAIASIPLDTPIHLTLHKGRIVKVQGGIAAREFEKRMDKAGANARVICEFGIGTNIKAIPSPEILEAEKAYGTCHIAFGRNITFGGVNDVPFHTDGLILKPTIEIDNSIIMKEGVLLNL